MDGTIRNVGLVLVMTLALAASACSSDEGTSGDGGDAGGTSVAITLQEFAVAANPASVPAGDVTFEAVNNGPADQHELVVVKTDLAPDALPTNPDGSVNEGGEGVTAIDEIPEFDVGADAEPDAQPPTGELRTDLQHLHGRGTGVALPGRHAPRLHRRVAPAHRMGRDRPRPALRSPARSARSGVVRCSQATSDACPSHPRRPRAARRSSCPPPGTPGGDPVGRPCDSRHPAAPP